MVRSLPVVVLLCGLLPGPAEAQFKQQGDKLVGTSVSPSGPAQQGRAVALSGDGNTAIVGGPNDNAVGQSAVGAAWVFTRARGAWRQQGQKLVGSGAVGRMN